MAYFPAWPPPRAGLRAGRRGRLSGSRGRDRRRRALACALLRQDGSEGQASLRRSQGEALEAPRDGEGAWGSVRGSARRVGALLEGLAFCQACNQIQTKN